MTTEESLLRAVCAEPADDLPRLAYADWCEENGQAERAELIRVQVDLARPAPRNEHRRALVVRERTLLKAHAAAWTKHLPAWAKRPEFRRGFVAKVEAKATAFAKDGAALRQRAPLEAVRLTDVPGHSRSLGSPALAGIAELVTHENHLGVKVARALARSPHLASLTLLDLTLGNIGVEGARELAASPHLGNLTSLTLRANLLGDAGAAALASSPHLTRLTYLRLGDNAIRDEGARALAASPTLANLTALDLSDNSLGEEAGKALLAWPGLDRLNVLDVGGAGIGEEAERVLRERVEGDLRL